MNQRQTPPRLVRRLWWAPLLMSVFLGACDADSPPVGQGEDSIEDNNGGQNNANNGDQSVCGDGICNGAENAQSCAADCGDGNNNGNNGNNGDGVCGDGTCGDGETPSNCAQDCVQGCDCAPEEICVNNDRVDDRCFPSDCDGQACADGEVCDGVACVSVSCAGVDCGGYPNVCRGGVCVVGSCNDPDVRCPEGQECIEDECRAACTTQADCGALACVDGYCVVCESAGECGPGLLCINDQCVLPCTEDPDQCTGQEVCDPDSGRCQPPCAQTGCGQLEVCDDLTGLCIDGQCEEMSDCPAGHLCQDTACVPVGPLWMGSLCSGCQTMQSGPYKVIGVVGPVEQAGAPAQSQRYQLQTGTISITSGQ
jgi:hypothetical protein